MKKTIIILVSFIISFSCFSQNSETWIRDTVVQGYSQNTLNNEYPKIVSYMGYYLWVDSGSFKTDSLLTVAIAESSVYELYAKNNLSVPEESNYPNWVIVKYAILNKNGAISRIIEKSSVIRLLERN